MKYILFVFSSVLILASCNSVKKAQQTPPPQVPEDPNTVVETGSTEDIEKKKDSAVVLESISTVLGKLNHIDYTTFSGRTGVTYSAKGDTKNFDAKIQMIKDSLIWISVTGPLGIEGGRGLITRDSVRIINKLDKQYIGTSYVYLQEQLGLPLDLGTLQDLLVGNPVFLDEKSSSYTKNGDSLIITSRTKFFRNLISVMAADFLPVYSQLDDVDSDRNRSATLGYSDYQKIDNAQFPKSRKINVKYKNDIQIQLNFKNYSFNEAVSTPFSVPKGYKRKK